MNRHKVRKVISKKPDIDTILNKKMWVIVDNHLRPITHAAGHIMIFYKKKDAQKWLDKNVDDRYSNWRLFPYKIIVEDI